MLLVPTDLSMLFTVRLMQVYRDRTTTFPAEPCVMYLLSLCLRVVMRGGHCIGQLLEQSLTVCCCDVE
jgi:hypothetical protein